MRKDRLPCTLFLAEQWGFTPVVQEVQETLSITPLLFPLELSTLLLSPLTFKAENSQDSINSGEFTTHPDLRGSAGYHQILLTHVIAWCRTRWAKGHFRAESLNWGRTKAAQLSRCAEMAEGCSHFFCLMYNKSASLGVCCLARSCIVGWCIWSCPRNCVSHLLVPLKSFSCKKKRSVLLHTGFKEETIYKHHLTSEIVFGTLIFDIGHFCSMLHHFKHNLIK